MSNAQIQRDINFMGELDTASNTKRESGPVPYRRKAGLGSAHNGFLRDSLGTSTRQSISAYSIQSIDNNSIHSMMTMTSAHTNSGSKNPISNDKKLSTLVHKKLPTITKYKK